MVGINLVKEISKGIAVLVCADLFIVMLTMMPITQGENVQHIPFWDAQIRFMFNLIT